MGKRHKKKTQTPGLVQHGSINGGPRKNPMDRIPKSMVIRMGASDVGPSVTQLVQDVRRVMEPHTASRLRERRSNKLRDYATMAGPLGVTHFLLFSRSQSSNTNMRIAITPRGPTLSFRVEKYSLCKDVAKALKHPKGQGGLEHLTPPLLVMNNFNSSSATDSSDKPSIPKHLESLTTSTFQSLFPAISPQRTPLSSIRRILLLNREATTSAADQGTYIINFRHYAISSKPLVPVSRGIKRLRTAEKMLLSSSKSTSTAQPTEGAIKRRRKGLPNLSNLDDVADFVLDPSSAGYTSASESEIDTDAEVEVLEPAARRVLNKRDKERRREAREAEEAELANSGSPPAEGEDRASAAPALVPHKRRGPPPQKRAIKLTELGPRMRLRLVKVEEGMCSGKVLWNEFVTKSADEERRMDMLWEERKQEREERRRVQRENVERKRAEKGGGKEGGTNDDEVLEDGEDMDFDDDEWLDDQVEGEMGFDEEEDNMVE